MLSNTKTGLTYRHTRSIAQCTLATDNDLLNTPTHSKGTLSLNKIRNSVNLTENLTFLSIAESTAKKFSPASPENL